MCAHTTLALKQVLQRCWHALADAKGRLLAILLTGGQAHDYPVAKRLIRRVAPPKHMLGDNGL